MAQGLALAYLSCGVPELCMHIPMLIAHSLCSMFGVIMGTLGVRGGPDGIAESIGDNVGGTLPGWALICSAPPAFLILLQKKS